MSAVGDWTKSLHAHVQEPTRRPAWISGPFASPYSTAGEYDNLILVASGIGITPALSLITTYKEKRRVNLIWSCRDASLVEFYLDKCQFSTDGWTLIYYTGKRQLELPRALPPTVLIFNGRPDLQNIVQEMIVGVETGGGLPEDLLLDAEKLEADLLVHAYQRAIRKANERTSDHLTLPIHDLGAAAPPPPPPLPPTPSVPRKQRSQLHDDHASMRSELPSVKEDEVVLDVKSSRSTSPYRKTAGLPTTSSERSSSPYKGNRDSFSRRLSLEAFDDGIKDMVKRVANSLTSRGGAAERRSVAPRASIGSTESKMSAWEGSSHPDELMSRRSMEREIMTKVKHERASVGDRRSQAQSRFSQAGSAPRPPKPEEKGKRQGSFVERIGQARLATWQMLYCGGSQPVVDALRGIERDFRVQLRTEKFDW